MDLLLQIVDMTCTQAADRSIFKVYYTQQKQDQNCHCKYNASYPVQAGGQTYQVSILPKFIGPQNIFRFSKVWSFLFNICV